jgi:hypothetical protein
MNKLDAILYINLDHRKDRLENITHQLLNSPVVRQVPIPDGKVQRIAGHYDPKNGPAGCATSHVKALNMAIDNNWNCVAIFEDDFAWKDNTTYIVDCLRKIDTTTVNWDVILLSTNKRCLKIIANVNDNFQKVANAQTTSGYIVRSKEYMIKLRDCFQNCILNLKQGLPKGKCAIDIAWKKFQPHDNWYCFREQLGKQIISYSDVENRVIKRSIHAFE